MASIGCDCRGGMEAAVRHLYGQGHRRIGLLFSALDSYIVKERYNAFFSAMEKCGLEVDQDLIGLGYYVAETTRKYLPKLIEKGATAMFAPTTAGRWRRTPNATTGSCASPRT